MAVIIRKSWVFQSARALGTLYGNKSLRHHDGTPALKRKMSSGEQSKLEALVTFGESKRTIRYEKGDDLKTFRHHFLRTFSDILSEDVAPGDVKFQKFDGNFNEYVESRCADVYHMTWYPVSTHLPLEFKPHPIQPHVHYQFWNPVCNGLIQMDPSTPIPIVTGKGTIGNSPHTVVQAEDFGHDLFYLYFTDGHSKMYITSQGEGEPIVAVETPTPTDHSIFKVEYYWSYTLFKSVALGNNNLYLGCDKDQNATLVRMPRVAYPDPRALFTVTQR
ncbi:hypothetical protein AWC38_SpisGene11750 [Stylophora pistillata]|uniref:Uncharacterized protein n=1 Tax=Stylophora pistillata TaxID=50429 RepID=A0A2B4S551_STYPI|nr:hypothetical protein AWC38_SpisGene11750 [Stylophora pistillata]